MRWCCWLISLLGNYMQYPVSPEYRGRIQIGTDRTPKKGLIRTLLLIVIGIVVISVLGFDIRAAVEDPQTQANFTYLGELAEGIWETYFAELWDQVWEVIEPTVDFLWSNFKDFDMENSVSDFGSFVEENAPEISVE